MVIKKFNQYIKESNTVDNHLLYYAFDWDDNILNMTTVIHMEHLINGEWIPEDVSTSKFAEVRNDKDNWRILNGDPEQAFSEFRDNGPRGNVAFLEDVKNSCASSFVSKFLGIVALNVFPSEFINSAITL